MCGIVGVASARPAGDRGLLERMREAIVHRGPDAGGEWWDAPGGVCLAHRRLSILDLSPAGRQPMDGPGGTTVAYNGEVYNFAELRDELRGRGHEFRTRTDTEVLLAAYATWGDACVERLRGMFAFALYDAPRRRLLLARDRAGEKPLFLHHAGGVLRFGSELKALLADPAVPREMDPEGLEYYLAYGYVPGGRSILRGVRKLPPGHLAVYDVEADRLEVRAYWRLPPPPPPGAPADPEALADELEALLLDAVRTQLVADVPVAVLLSGGLDSSLVTAMAARSSAEPVRTFTVSFPGHGAFDESGHARLVASHFGTRHTELPMEPASVELLPALARQYDEPIADSSMLPTYLVSRLVRGHATVALGGDGGDELFGGYTHYRWILKQERLRRVVPRPLRQTVGAAAAALPVGVRGRNHLVAFGRDRGASIAGVNLYFDAAGRRALLRPTGWAAPALSPEAFRGGLCADRGSALQQATAADFLTYLPDDILVKVDRASMLTSLEMRAPFLDHRIVELAFGRVPDSLRATAGEGKILPRLLARRLLPPELDLTRKQGFSIPLASWFRGSWGGYVEEVLRGAPAGLFDPAVIGGLLASQKRGLANTHRLFSLTLFELWRREYGITFGA